MVETAEGMVSKVDRWRTHLEGLDASGLSMREYCKREGIGLNGLRYWKAKLSERENEPSVVKIAVSLASVPPDAA